jgi:hypothetical protein
MTPDLLFAMALVCSIMLVVIRHREDAERQREQEWFLA